MALNFGKNIKKQKNLPEDSIPGQVLSCSACIFVRKKMDGTYSEEVCICALNKIFGFKPRIAAALMKSLGSASAVFSLSDEDLDRILGASSAARSKINRHTLDSTAMELERLSSEGYSFTFITSPDYPALLKECEDPPVWLYIKSISRPDEIFRDKTGISVVGTRDISPYGKEWCCRIVSAFSRSETKPPIISGLAFGTDITAHTAAIENGLPTIAVMATGIDSVYPARHSRAASIIAGTPGCALITDYPPGTQPLRINFLRRNRIIAGLGTSTILVESRSRGGGILTARLAFSYSRDVYALPGRIDDERSQGCNLLIKEKIAEPIISVAQIMESTGAGPYHGSPTGDPVSMAREIYGKESIDRVECLTRIILSIRNTRGITVEEIASDICLPYKYVLECTAMLESDGIITTDLMQRCYIRLK